jgi:hypothetical protein
MALALHMATGHDLVAEYRGSALEHVAIRTPDDRVIDVGGARPSSALQTNGSVLRPMTREHVEQLHNQRGWVVPELQLAAAWVPSVLEKLAAGTPHQSAGCFCDDELKLGDYEIHIEWSRVDMGERLTAFARARAPEAGGWARCGVMSIRPDENGLRVIDFRDAVFAEHAARFKAALRSARSSTIAIAKAPVDAQLPLCPP